MLSHSCRTGLGVVPFRATYALPLRCVATEGAFAWFGESLMVIGTRKPGTVGATGGLD